MTPAPDDRASQDESARNSTESGALTLVHIQGSLQGSTSIIDGSSAMLGRAPGLDVAFDPTRDRQVSGRHARVYADSAGHWVVEDLGSTNGTHLNGARLNAPAVLQAGDVLRFGSMGSGEGMCEMQIQLGHANVTGTQVAEIDASIRLFTTPPSISGAHARSPHQPQNVEVHEPAGDGFLGLGRIKSALGRIVTRREIMKEIEQCKALVESARPATRDLSRSLGCEAWSSQEGGVGLDDLSLDHESARALAVLDQEVAALNEDDALKAEQERSLDAAFETFMTGHNARLEELTRECAIAASATDAAEGRYEASRREAAGSVDSRLADIERLGDDLKALAGRHRQAPASDFTAQLHDHMGEFESRCAALREPIDGIAERLQARDAAATAAIQAQERRAAARQDLDQSLAEKAAKEEEHRVARSVVQTERRRNRVAIQGANASMNVEFVKLGEWLIRRTPTPEWLGELPSYASARAASANEAELAQKVTQLEEEVARLA